MPVYLPIKSKHTQNIQKNRKPCLCLAHKCLFTYVWWPGGESPSELTANLLSDDYRHHVVLLRGVCVCVWMII